MSIGNAVQRGNFVYLYDEDGRYLGSVLGSNAPDEGLAGYTSNRVNVRRGGVVYSYDERGNHISTALAD